MATLLIFSIVNGIALLSPNTNMLLVRLFSEFTCLYVCVCVCVCVKNLMEIGPLH